jgi:exonuclease III
MNLNLVSWNVRGLNNGDKRIQVCNLLHFWRADMVCLQETKLEVVNKDLVRSLWRCRYVDWIYKESLGASRGLF